MKNYHYKLLTLFFFITNLIEIHAQVMWQVSAEKVVKWYYYDGDEFSGTKLNTDKWLTGYPYGKTLYCNDEQEIYTDGRNLEIQNGNINLIAKREKVSEKILNWEPDQYVLKCGDKEKGINKKTFDYTSGMIHSVKKYHFGYYEIKFKSDNGKGLWPAFWLYAGHNNDEIDIFEIKGERNSDLHVDVHCPDGCDNYAGKTGLVKKNWGDYLKTSSAWSEGFNVIGLEWTPDYIKWYLNGKGIAYWKGKMEFPASLIANLAIPSDNGPFGPGPDATTSFPAKFIIDYIRIWSSQPVSETQQNPGIVLGSSESTSIPVINSRLVKKKRPEFNKSKLKDDIVNVTFSKSDENSYVVSLTSVPSGDFSIEVTGSNGEIIYKSTDSEIREHHFNDENANGNSKMIINLNGEKIEHKF